MEAARIHKKMAGYGDVAAIYDEAFPRYETLPMWWVRWICRLKGNDFWAFYDGGRPVGFANTYEGKDNAVFILYLAVSRDVRSQGYGSKILEWHKQHYAGKSLFLCVEPPAADAPNAEQRQKRLAFYKRNGFKETGDYFRDFSGLYAMLSTDPGTHPVLRLNPLLQLALGISSTRLASRQG